MKTHTQRADARKRSRWMRGQQPGKRVQEPVEAFAIMVKLISKPRAARLVGDGTLTVRKANAFKVYGRKGAEAVATNYSTRDGVERAWVVPF